MNVIFMGSAQFSLSALEKIYSKHNVVAVYTNPPRPSGRGMQLTKTPIHNFADTHQIPCFTPTSLKGMAEEIMALNPDVIVVAAYGLIVPQAILDIPRYGCINIHGSILPKWRGAAPIQYAIWEGDDETGVTIMYMDKGMDTGDMLIIGKISILPNDNFVSLTDKLSELGANLIMEFLEKPEFYLDRAQKQNNELATYTKKISKKDMELDFSNDAKKVVNTVRAFYPSAWFSFHGTKVKVLEAEYVEVANDETGILLDKQFTVSCMNGSVRLITVKPESKGEMSAKDFLLNRVNFILRKVSDD